MINQTIKYIDYNGNEREEEFRFNLSAAEVTEMELSIKGGLVEKIKRISAAQDGAEIIQLFKDIIFKAYGEKSADGKYFVKSKELSTSFSQTEAYSTLFMRLATEPDEAAKFINGIVPQQEKPALDLK